MEYLNCSKTPDFQTDLAKSQNLMPKKRGQYGHIPEWPCSEVLHVIDRVVLEQLYHTFNAYPQGTKQYKTEMYRWKGS